MKVLFGASEIFPYAKTGGLADVAQALPHALSKHVDIICVMPLYGFLDKTLLEKNELNFSVLVGQNTYEITLFSAKFKGVITYFIDLALFSETKDFYTDKSGAYANDNPSFGVFSAAIVELAKLLSVDIVHLNDWHTALAALWIKEDVPNVKTVFTIHNLAYQGLFEKEVLSYLGIDKSYFTLEGIEFYGKLSFIKAGVAYSDLVTTVSPQYAKEILSERYGCGLHSFLKHHSKKLSGILNGIDFELFNPKTDKVLATQFDSSTLDLKYLNKKALLKELDLEVSDKPLFVIVSRLVEQKGFDLLIDSLDDILSNDLNFVVVADGEGSYRHKLEVIASRYNNFCLRSVYDENFAHRVYAGADFLLMPSLFEPCGLNQMIAMRYGAIAVVHGVGGLLNTVHEDKNRCGEGIVFLEQTKEALLNAIDRALELSKDIQKMRDMIYFNMRCDFSFDKSAQSYLELYKRLVG